MNNIQNYGSVNVNTNYGKINKSPNFKAFISVNRGTESLKTLSENIEKYVMLDDIKVFGGLRCVEDNLNMWIKKFKAALNLKKAASGTEYFDGILVGESYDSGIRYRNTDKIYTVPFRFSEKEGSRVIEGITLKENDFEPIMELTEEEAAKLQDFSAASVLEACENSIKQKIRQIQNMTSELIK